ncbi:MAG TPA: thioredoxin family protein [Acidimicrobiia bacterium]|nr:thioredoxin family protein [Acidimicrobiia bacterium]
MKNKNTVFLAVLTLSCLLLVASLSGCSSNSKSDSESKKSSTETSQDKKTDKEPVDTGEPAASAGIFEDYTEELVTSASSGDRIILFFHADWCPTCRSIEKDINSNLSDIPDGTRILKVDYDSEDDLKKKYGVRSQYTMVQVDNSGNKIDLWNDSFSLSDILKTAV